MRRLRPSLRLAPAVLALGALLAGCDAPPSGAGPEDVEQRLVGTWLREHDAADVRSRRILTLASDGTFREAVRVVDRTGASTEYRHEGAWFYDGTNLKRKYTLYNGAPPSRLNVPFVTFQIEFRTRNEFVGVDHIHRNRVEYRRVQPETQL
jgi:hypothetical protein